LNSAAAFCLDYYTQKREAEKEERRMEFEAALRGVDFPA
jgi:hypothetical protein